MSNTPYHTLIKELPEAERPRERLQLHGEGALSNAELVAIALGSGSRGQNALSLGQQLLAEFSGLSGVARASIAQLCSVSGVGPAKAAQIKAALELGRRLVATGAAGQSRITCPDDAAARFVADMSTLPQEELHVMLLDTKNQVLRVHTVYVGNVNTSMIRVGEVFREAIKDNAVSIIVAHNHPSGDPTPSPEDVSVTREILRAGQMLDIDVLDHLVIGKNRYISMKACHLGFD